MSKYGERFRYQEPRDYRAELAAIRRDNPIVCEPAVLADSYGLWVQCGCSTKFEYLQDQLQCPRCLRIFNPREAEDKVGSEPYGGVEVPNKCRGGVNRVH